MSTESERVARLTAEGEKFVPEGTGPKKYVVTCKNSSDWNEIHDYIINENEIDGIPNRKIECTDDCKSCDRMATYEMSDEEAEQLKLHPKVAGVNVDPDYYQGTFKGYADQVISTTNRYGTNVKIGRDFSSNFFPTSPDSSLLRRTGASIYRHQQKDDPWDGSADSTIINADPEYRGDGTDVDVIVCDESGWYGHVEFIKTGVGEPSNFVGENVLKSGFSTSSTTGKCGVLDCVLDLPYYLDPDFFEANVGTALTTRWDGTTVPTDSAAQNWWNNNSTTYRSAKYVSSGNGGSATGNNDFGTVTISSSYTRANSNGSNTTQHAGGGFHATPCMAQAYGKTHGWAFNANKWHMSIIWSTGAASITSCFKILKIFHQCKPNRSSDNTKNPTITSHSWGRNRNVTNGYYYFRTSGDGTGGVSYTSSTRPGFLNNLYYGNRYTSHADPSYSESVLGKAIVDAGVIFVSAAGNDNQKMVLDGHADYNNYDDSGSSTTLASALTGDFIGRTSMTNRPGFPSDVGFDDSSGTDVYQSFNIGALDSNKSSNTQERKANYSNMGNGIDCYGIGADSLAGCDDNSSGRKNRYDAYYNIESASTYNISASNVGAGAYSLSGSDRNGTVNGNNVTVTLNVGDTVNFSVNASGHPFWIKTTNNTGTGDGASGVSNNGSQSGTVSWTPDTDGTYYYICQFHGSMVGTITVQYTSRESEDREFGGTSSACPVVTGLMATKLQHNRTWTWSNVKTWLANDVTDQSSSAFYTGTESTTANDSGWAEDYNLQGGLRKIIWDAAVSPQTSLSDIFALKFSTGNLILSGALTIKTPPNMITSNLVLHLDAGDSNSYVGSGTTWVDISGEGNNGTLTNGPTFNSGDGGYFDFDGTNDYVSLGTSINSDISNYKDCSFNIWLQFDIDSRDNVILTHPNIDGHQPFILWYDKNAGGGADNTGNGDFGGGNTNVLTVMVTNNPAAQTGEYRWTTTNNVFGNSVTNTWHNICVVLDTTNDKYYTYLNGQQVALFNSTAVQGINSNYQDFHIARSNNSHNSWFDGKVSQFLVYSKALSSNEVMQNYDALKSRYGY